MTPPQEMRAAADLIDSRVRDFIAEEVRSPYWQGGNWAQGVDNAMGGAGGRLAALFTPEVAAQTSGWLKRSAKTWDAEVKHDELHDTCNGAVGEDCWCFDRPIGVARALLAGAK
ncbi:hypothetical protein ABGB08_14570 [Acrocarpospora sp. B8E8]